MRKVVFIVILSIVSLVSNAQELVRNWNSVNLSGSCISFNNKLKESYDINKIPLASLGIGYQYGWTINKFDIVLDGRFENSLISNDKALSISYPSFSLNFGYAIIKQNDVLLLGHIGAGIYSSYLIYGEDTDINSVLGARLSTSMIRQGLNLFIPIGITGKVAFNEKLTMSMDLSYRYSICTGSSKAFGSSTKINDLPDVKLNGLSLTIGWEFPL
ncbi:MAG: hypothetical protein LBO06_06755 [Bacteroidales bacterium]|jgi:hypothetical protein|nr:hypothetical protein [Bacteroidales bacterium]